MKRRVGQRTHGSLKRCQKETNFFKGCTVWSKNLVHKRDIKKSKIFRQLTFKSHPSEVNDEKLKEIKGKWMKKGYFQSIQTTKLGPPPLE